MDQNYLQQLIAEVKARDGGLILNMDNLPAAVVLSIDKYNELVASSKHQAASQTETEQSTFHPKTILVTGGAGYIGAHLARQLVNAGHKVVVLDNLSTGRRQNVPDGAKFIEGNVGDVNLLRDIFLSEKVDAVMHLAASIEVEESVKEPILYLENNAVNTARLLAVMDEAGVREIVFSSTAAVYAGSEVLIAESSKLKPANPYGDSKLVAEKIIKYFCEHRGFKAVIFRYFNACGCDFDGKILTTHESHLLAKLMRVVTAKDEQLVVNGNDYDTTDGTCVRDYVHVLDIAAAHMLALEKLPELSGLNIYNIGTGRGTSVLEMVNAVSEILNRMIPMQLGQRRLGDATMCVADASKIQNELGFKAQFSDLETIIKTAYRQAQN